MADEENERNSPRSTSEATPPHVDDSPEMVSQPSPPEEQRVSSSTDGQPPEAADSPDAQRVSSTSDLEPNDGAACSSRLTAAELLLLQTNEARTVEGGSPPNLPTQSSVDAAPEMENEPQPDAPPDPAIRLLLEAGPVLPRSDEPVQSTVGGALIQAGLVRASLGSPLLGRAMKAAQVKRAESQEIANDATKRNIDEEKSDSNQEFDADDSSTGSKSPPENVDLGSDSSPTGSDVTEDSGSNVTETAGLGSDSSPRIGAATEEKSSSGIGATETVGLEGESSESQTGRVILVSGRGAKENIVLRNELSPSKTDSTASVSGSGTTGNVGVRSELSTSKTDTSSVEESGSTSGTPERRRQSFSPKRKSPTKFLHLSPKRSAPFNSPDKLQRQSDSQMSTLLEELDIKEAENKSASSEPISRHEQEMSAEMGETGESLNEEASMEVQETDSKTEHGETEKYSKMEESD